VTSYIVGSGGGWKTWTDGLQKMEANHVKNDFCLVTVTWEDNIYTG